MKIQCFIFNPVQENTYLVWDEVTHEAAIIDAGMSNKQECDIIFDFIEKNQLKLKYALQTHMHFDHVYGLAFIKKTYDIVPLYHILDEATYHEAMEMACLFRLPFDTNLPHATHYVNDGDTFTLGTTTIRAVHTPGHTPGGLTYITDCGMAFCGDTLFRCSIGRTDLSGGNMEQEINSIQSKIMVLPSSTVLYSGHGSETTVEYEKRNNPYLNIRR